MKYQVSVAYTVEVEIDFTVEEKAQIERARWNIIEKKYGVHAYKIKIAEGK